METDSHSSTPREFGNPGIIRQLCRPRAFPSGQQTGGRLPVLVGGDKDCGRERHQSRERDGRGTPGHRTYGTFLLPATLGCSLPCSCFTSSPANTWFWWGPGLNTPSFFLMSLWSMLVERHFCPTSLPLSFLSLLRNPSHCLTSAPYDSFCNKRSRLEFGDALIWGVSLVYTEVA